MDTTATSAGTREVSSEIRTAVSSIYRRFRSERSPGELGDAAMGVLTQLRKNGPLTLKALSGLAHVTPGSMSQTVNRLTKDGYAVRTGDPDDRRRVLFEPTSDGLAIEAAHHARSTSWLDSAIEQLTDDQRGLLRDASSLLRAIAES